MYPQQPQQPQLKRPRSEDDEAGPATKVAIICLATKELEIEDAYVGDGQSAKPKQIAMFVLFIAITFLSSPSSSIQHPCHLEHSTPIPSRTNSTPSPIHCQCTRLIGSPTHFRLSNYSYRLSFIDILSLYLGPHTVLSKLFTAEWVRIFTFILNNPILYRYSATVIHILVLAMHLLQ